MLMGKVNTMNEWRQQIASCDWRKKSIKGSVKVFCHWMSKITSSEIFRHTHTHMAGSQTMDFLSFLFS